MVKNKQQIVNVDVKNKIYSIRGQQVMIDSDLAELYQVETKALNQAVKRNEDRFPKDFMFQLTKKEFLNLRSQIVTSSLTHGGRRKLPYVFTEQGVSMLASILKSKVATSISIKIIRTFVQMRKFLISNTQLFSRLDNLEAKQSQYKLESDKNFQKIFRALDQGKIKPKQGIFYNGQIFDAYVFIANLVKSADKEIILIDNYVDETVLDLFAKRKKKIKVIIYTQRLTKILRQDLEKYNQQHQDKIIEIKKFKKSHDRFLIIDKKEIYHIGASLKDLGKKWFAFSRLKIAVEDVLKRLK
jgi:hypothetical protein